MRSRRFFYGLRAYLPGLRRRHQLEALVGPLGYWDQLQRYQLKVLLANGLKPSHYLLDIGCGPLQGGIAFIRHLEPGRYTGVEVDPGRVQVAHEQIADHRLEDRKPVVVLSTTFGDNELDGTMFDFIWASQILYYFDEAKMSSLFSVVRKRLREGGKFLGDIHGPRHYQFRFPEGSLVLHRVETLQAWADRHGLRARSLGEIVQYGYPRRLSLHSNLLMEFTLKEAPAPRLAHAHRNDAGLGSHHAARR